MAPLFSSQRAHVWDQYPVWGVCSWLFLAGDAAHVASPRGFPGAQTASRSIPGLELAMVLKVSPASLLDKPPGGLLPLQQRVLGRSIEVVSFRGVPKRGGRGLQLLLNYRGHSLTLISDRLSGKLRRRTGTDAICENSYQDGFRLFDLFFRGPHFTLLAFRRAAAPAIRDLEWTPVDILLKCSVRLSRIVRIIQNNYRTTAMAVHTPPTGFRQRQRRFFWFVRRLCRPALEP